MSISLSFQETQERFGLLCRATDSFSDTHDEIQSSLSDLRKLISQELLTLARRGSPDHFAELYLAFGREMDRFAEFCAFPFLASRFVVGFGGAFSAGKSSLINALMAQKLLVTEVDPTTSLPSYLLQGGEDKIFALNLHRQLIELSPSEFSSLTHDERLRFGSQVSSLLQAAFITRQAFPWENLAIIDTPGYSKPDSEQWSERTDENLARAQLNAAQAVVWVISAKSGGITEDDINFLARLRPEIPKLIALTRADSAPEEDIRAIVEGVVRSTTERNIPVIAVIPVTNRNLPQFPLTPLLEKLYQWNLHQTKLRFAYNFKALFTQYSRSIEAELRHTHWQLNRLNRMVILVEDQIILSDVQAFKTEIDEQLQRLDRQLNDLVELRNRFFIALKHIGDKVGIPLPEPHEIDLLSDGGVKLIDILIQMRMQQGTKEKDMRTLLHKLIQGCQATNTQSILRRRAMQHSERLSLFTRPKEIINFNELVRHSREKPNQMLSVFANCVAKPRSEQCHD